MVHDDVDSDVWGSVLDGDDAVSDLAAIVEHSERDPFSL